MIKIINATNLLGDSIYAINAIKGFMALHPEDDVYIVADKGLVFEMYCKTFLRRVFASVQAAVGYAGEHSFEVIKLSAGDSGKICFDSASQKNKQLHITEGYAELLGYHFEGSLKPDVPWVNNHPLLPVTIGVAPFSRSCSRHSGDKPNKTLDDWKWNNLINYLRQQDSSITIFCGPNDRLEKVAVSEDEYFSAMNFEHLCANLRRCKLFVTVDNGLGHLASLLDVPTIILWPIVSCIGFIAPMWAPNTRYIQLEPNAASPAAILSGLRPYCREMLNADTIESR